MLIAANLRQTSKSALKLFLLLKDRTSALYVTVL